MALKIFKKENEAKEAPAKKETAKGKEVLTAGKYNVLKSPCITEKAVNMSAGGNFYTFHVYAAANKVEIKKAVEEKYKVDVIQVRTVSIPRKKMMRGRTAGYRSGYKKAIVKIKEGQKIEIVGQ